MLTLLSTGAFATFCVLVTACGPQISKSAQPNNQQTAVVNNKPEQALQVRIEAESPEIVIWTGVSGGFEIRWTTRELYAASPAKTANFFEPIVKKEFTDFAEQPFAVREDLNPGADKCEYLRFFQVVSIVGTLVTFEDDYAVFCGGAHPTATSRFSTIDLTKSGVMTYESGKDRPADELDLRNLGNGVKLTDYFSEEDILQALLTDSTVKKAIESSKDSQQPTSLTEVAEFFRKNYYALRIDDSSLNLRPDFLTRFAFHHVKGNKVAVRIRLSPTSQAEHALRKHLELLLPIPEVLKEPLTNASQRQEGFLMKDASKIAKDRTTSLTVKFTAEK